jgi:hypothetical protein
MRDQAAINAKISRSMKAYRERELEAYKKRFPYKLPAFGACHALAVVIAIETAKKRRPRK